MGDTGPCGAESPPSAGSRRAERRWDAIALSAIVVVISFSFLPTLTSGNRLNENDDFLQHAARYEAFRKSVLEHHAFPMRSHWFGGGYPTLGDPEDPSLNPLALLALPLGAVLGMKWIVFSTTLAGGLSAYWLGRRVLGYTTWGSLFSGLVFGVNLFVPSSINGGNIDEVCVSLFPLCLLLIGLSCRGRKAAFLALPFLFYAMLAEGNLSYIMAMVYVGVLCLGDLAPGLGPLASAAPASRVDSRPLKVFLLALGATVLIGMARIAPALEVIGAKGGLGNLAIASHPEGYTGFGWSLEYVFPALIGIPGRQCDFTIGWIPVILFGIALAASWRKTLPWAFALLLFGWLFLGENAPIDLYAQFRKLPVFGAVTNPLKYFGFPIVFTFAIASGEAFTLLKRVRPRWLEHLIAVLLIAGAVGFLIPKVRIYQNVYSLTVVGRLQQAEFFNVEGVDLDRFRKDPPGAVAYFNVLHNVGTIDWCTALPLAENAAPKYYVDRHNNFWANPEYRGEAFFLRPENKARAEFHPNSITVETRLESPDTLVVNQNYDRSWRSSRGELFDRNGLIAVRLTEPGAYTLRLRYHPGAFYGGLAISLASLAALAWICWAHRSGTLTRWAAEGSPSRRRVAQLLLWTTS